MSTINISPGYIKTFPASAPWTNDRWESYAGLVRPVDIQQVGEELAVKWDDGSESYVRLETLRRCCPCAGCRGETDIMGNVYRSAAQPLPPQACQLLRIANVGGYAIQPVWADGHSTGLFAFDYLRKVADAQGAGTE